METSAFGPHITIDLWDVDKKFLVNYQLHYEFLKSLPMVIGMTPITQPYVFPYEGLKQEDRGITGIVIIAESHLSIHSFEEKGWSFIDIFSCKPFDVEKCIQFVKDFFGNCSHAIKVTERGIGFPR